MTWPRRYSIKLLLFVMMLVAHAASKPSVAKRIHPGPVESISTSLPFVITVEYLDEQLNTNTKTYLGALGQYWLYSHHIALDMHSRANGGNHGD